jgi:hypothetical protein
MALIYVSITALMFLIPTLSDLSVTWAKKPLFLRYVLIVITVLELIYTACTHGYHTSWHFSINYVPSKTSSQYLAIERGTEGMKVGNLKFGDSWEMHLSELHIQILSCIQYTYFWAYIAFLCSIPLVFLALGFSDLPFHQIHACVYIAVPSLSYLDA